MTKQVLRVLVLVLTAVAAVWAADLETINVEQRISVDPKGDGTMTLKMVMTGKQFQNWQSKYGTNQSLLKRDLTRFVSQYETADWKVDTQQMDRTVTIKVNIAGSVIHEGGGRFQFRVPKAWKGGERHENIFDYNYVEPAGGGAVLQNQIKLELPPGSSDFTEDKSETGDRIVRYTLSEAVGSSLLLWIGLVSLVAGGGMLGTTLLSKKA